VSLPTADELFRPTGKDGRRAAPTAQPVAQPPAEPAPAAESAPAEAEDGTPSKRPSGRVRHDEKMTVYITSEELMDLEHARLLLRRSHSLAVDRGRVVREAIAIALADFEQNGDDSVIVQRLREA
jgi:hypothetical protein